MAKITKLQKIVFYILLIYLLLCSFNLLTFVDTCNKMVKPIANQTYARAVVPAPAPVVAAPAPVVAAPAPVVAAPARAPAPVVAVLAPAHVAAPALTSDVSQPKRKMTQEEKAAKKAADIAAAKAPCSDQTCKKERCYACANQQMLPIRIQLSDKLKEIMILEAEVSKATTLTAEQVTEVKTKIAASKTKAFEQFRAGFAIVVEKQHGGAQSIMDRLKAITEGGTQASVAIARAQFPDARR